MLNESVPLVLIGTIASHRVESDQMNKRTSEQMNTKLVVMGKSPFIHFDAANNRAGVNWEPGGMYQWKSMGQNQQNRSDYIAQTHRRVPSAILVYFPNTEYFEQFGNGT